MAEYYKCERTCDECASTFWGTAGAKFCSASCRSRRWRELKVADRSRPLAETCEQVARLSHGRSAAYSKLLIRLLRLVAADLRSRGWDPVELLNGKPEDPVTGADESPGGIEGESPNRVKRLHSPALELELLEETIERRTNQGKESDWHTARRDALLHKLKQR
jgi:hypothetical protein